jgi:hypothetical protein
MLGVLVLLASRVPRLRGLDDVTAAQEPLPERA